MLTAVYSSVLAASDCEQCEADRIESSVSEGETDVQKQGQIDGT